MMSHQCFDCLWHEQESGTRRINIGETVQLDTDVVGPFGHGPGEDGGDWSGIGCSRVVDGGAVILIQVHVLLFSIIINHVKPFPTVSDFLQV